MPRVQRPQCGCLALRAWVLQVRYEDAHLSSAMARCLAERPRNDEEAEEEVRSPQNTKRSVPYDAWRSQKKARASRTPQIKMPHIFCLAAHT